MSTKEDEKIKRRPGRPRKHALKEPKKRQGIAQSPEDQANVIELLYDKPINFKKICCYWKSLNAEKIKFMFTPQGLVLYTKNYKETNDVGITCDGSKLNHYYCGQPMTIGVTFSNLELVLNKLDKSYETISFLIRGKSQNKTLFIVLYNDVDIPEYFELDIIMDQDDKHIEYQALLNDPTPYSLEFKLPGKYFKKMISDTKQFDKQWTIEKYGENNLLFKYQSGNGQVKATIIPKKLKDIGLKSIIKANEIFSVSVYVDTIKPTSSNYLSDTIYFRTSKDRPLCMIADLDDKAIIAHIFAKIVDHRAIPNKT